ncbi:MAG: hypothetical protein IT208_00240 [Chthonomonadales bacterium]|nr:hypothetical protein [Chthonomonadales bacterium]
MRPITRARPLVLVALVCFGAAAAAAPKPAVLHTPALRAEFRDGEVISLTNRLTGERLVLPAAPAALAGLRRAGLPQLRCSEAPERESRPLGRGVRQRSAWPASSTSGAAAVSTDAAPDGADLVVRQQGRASSRSVAGVAWAIANVPDRLTVLVPGNSGQRFGADAPRGSRAFDYPLGWEAGFVLIQGERGGVLVMDDEPAPGFKELTVQHTAGALRLRLESRNVAPFEPLSGVRGGRWRMTAYRGPWQVGAALYRRRVGKRLDLTPRRTHGPAWAAGIRGVVTMAMDQSVLAELARRVDPRQTLLYIPDWRRDGYDRNYPDYTALPAFGPFVAAAHRLGFRVMPHVNYFGCDPKNPLYAELRRYQMRDPFTRELLWWDWPRADPPIRFAYINPASDRWRRLFVSRMRELYARYRVDALHLDQTLCIFNDANGRVDGRTCIQGNRLLHRDLRRALPEVALSGEGLNEVTCRDETFAQRHAWGVDHTEGTWTDRLLDMAHPVSSAVLLPRTAMYGYLGMPNPGTSPDLTMAWLRAYDHFGVLPTFCWPSVEQLRAPQPLAATVLSTIRFWQRRRPEPDFSPGWAASDLFRYRLAGGGRAVVRGGQGAELVELPAGRGRSTRGPERVVWRRLYGVSQARLPDSLPGWPAYDAERLLGLDPGQSYLWSPEPRDLTAPHLAALPDGFTVTRAGVHPDLLRFALELTPSGDAPNTIRLWDFRGSASGGASIPGRPAHRFPEGEFADEATGATAQVDGPGLFVHPPWRGLPPVQKAGPHALTFVEYRLRVPDTPLAWFESGVHLRPGAQGRSDGVTFRVIARAGAVRISAETHNDQTAPLALRLDLSRFRRREITLRLEADPGPAGSPAFDWGRFEQPRVVGRAAGPGAERSVLIAGRAVRVLLAAEGEPRARAVPGGMEVRLPLPNVLLAPSGDPLPVRDGSDLLALPFAVRSLTASGMETPGAVFPVAVAEAACGGEPQRALGEHPPTAGRTLVDYWLALPADPMRLVTAVGLRDGSKSTGAAFEVEVNGRRVLREAAKPGEGWKPVEVDLRPWAGRRVMLTLVTDSLGDYTFDWCVWAEPRLAAGR